MVSWPIRFTVQQLIRTLSRPQLSPPSFQETGHTLQTGAQGHIPLWPGQIARWTGVSADHLQAKRLQRPTDPTDPQPTGETCLCRHPALPQHDFQSHHQAAVQAQHQVSFLQPVGINGNSRLLIYKVRLASAVKSTSGRLAVPSRPGSSSTGATSVLRSQANQPWPNSASTWATALNSRHRRPLHQDDTYGSDD
jgi:hypothetical protein